MSQKLRERISRRKITRKKFTDGRPVCPPDYRRSLALHTKPKKRNDRAFKYFNLIRIWCNLFYFIWWKRCASRNCVFLIMPKSSIADCCSYFKLKMPNQKLFNAKLSSYGAFGNSSISELFITRPIHFWRDGGTVAAAIDARFSFLRFEINSFNSKTEDGGSIFVRFEHLSHFGPIDWTLQKRIKINGGLNSAISIAQRKN